MFWFGELPLTRPFGCTGGLLFCQVVFGPIRAPLGDETSGNAVVARLASSTSVQLRLPFPPWPACTNQSRPHGVAVALLTSFCIEMEPSEQVVWLWKSPETYAPPVLAAPAMPATVLIVVAPSAAAIAIAIRLLLVA